MACDASRLGGVEGVESIGEAVSGRGVRLRVRDAGFTLASLPREALEALLDCEVVEVEYPDGRVVYITGGWVRRLVERLGEGAGPRR